MVLTHFLNLQSKAVYVDLNIRIERSLSAIVLSSPLVLTDLALKGTEWLLYVSPWRLEDNTETSNIKIICKVAGYSLVSYTPSLQDYGSAIIYNIGQSG